MAIFEQRVFETRVYEILVRVEADTEEEAKNLIAIGDTVLETDVRLEGVVNRESWDDLIKLS